MEEKKAPENGGLDIKEALGKINVDYVAADVSEKNSSGGGIEFEFISEASAGGLVFEDESKPAAEVQEQTEPENSDSNTDSGEEFTIPESFEINEKYNTPASNNEQTTIWSTYVPRFTEVSENYRMVNDPRPRPQDEVTVEDVSVSESQKDISSQIDPTAEYDSDEQTDAVEVTSGGDVKLEDFSESLNIFKFSDGKSNRTSNIPAAGVKHEKINDAEVPSEAPAIDENPLPEEPVYQAPKQEPAPRPKANTEIPDPLTSDVQVIDYQESGSGALEQYIAPPSGLQGLSDSKKEASGEYTAYFQRDNFKDKFLDSLLSSKIRAVAAMFLAIVLMIFENIGYIGINITEMLKLTANPWAISVIDFQLALCILLIAAPEIIDSFKQLKFKNFMPELSLIPSFAVVFACAVVNISTNDRTPIFVSFIFAVHVIVAIWGSSLRKSADFTAFKATSLNGEKKILDVSPTKNLPAENLALDGAVDEYKSGTVRIFRASFISDFFKRTSKRKENTFVNILILAISLGVALIAGAICFFVYDGISDAMPAFAIVYLLSLPAVSMLVHKFPYYHAQKESFYDKAVIVGEASLYDFESADVITFEDTEIFGEDDVVLKRFMLYGDRENMAKAMRQMSSLFAAFGGPLDKIFAKALEKRSAPATSTVIEDDGISGNVDGVRICAGTFEYMSRHGIEVNSDRINTENGADTTRVMYAAEGGIVYAKFYIRYSFSEEFSAILPSLREKNIVPLIYTRDPNISNDLLKTLTAGQGVMRVMKRHDTPEGEDECYLRVSAGVVTFGNKMNALRSVLLAKKYTALQSALSVASIAAMALGCIVSCLLGLLKISTPSFFAAIWQILCCGVLYVADRKIFAVDKTIKENESENNDESK